MALLVAVVLLVAAAHGMGGVGGGVGEEDPGEVLRPEEMTETWE